MALQLVRKQLLVVVDLAVPNEWAAAEGEHGAHTNSIFVLRENEGDNAQSEKFPSRRDCLQAETRKDAREGTSQASSSRNPHDVSGSSTILCWHAERLPVHARRMGEFISTHNSRVIGVAADTEMRRGGVQLNKTPGGADGTGST